jgi:hypothetical protein
MKNPDFELTPLFRAMMSSGIMLGLILFLALFHFSPWSPRQLGDNEIMLPLPSEQEPLMRSEPKSFAPPRSAPSSNCNIEFINGQHFADEYAVSRDEIIGVGGWLVDRKLKIVPKHAWIILTKQADGTSYESPITFWMSRPDVKDALGGKAIYEHSGFISNMQANKLTPGKYHMYMGYSTKVSDQTQYYSCDNGRFMDIN